ASAIAQLYIDSIFAWRLERTKL
ncbi:hypothetical protein RRG08_015373, partial [Elysia crispata]